MFHPSNTDEPSPDIYIEGFPKTTTNHGNVQHIAKVDVLDHFDKWNPHSAKVAKVPVAKGAIPVTLGYGYLHFTSKNAAAMLMAETGGVSEIKGKPITLTYAPRNSKDSTDGVVLLNVPLRFNTNQAVDRFGTFGTVKDLFSYQIRDPHTKLEEKDAKRQVAVLVFQNTGRPATECERYINAVLPEGIFAVRTNRLKELWSYQTRDSWTYERFLSALPDQAPMPDRMGFFTHTAIRRFFPQAGDEQKRAQSHASTKTPSSRAATHVHFASPPSLAPFGVPGPTVVSATPPHPLFVMHGYPTMMPQQQQPLQNTAAPPCLLFSSASHQSLPPIHLPVFTRFNPDWIPQGSQ